MIQRSELNPEKVVLSELQKANQERLFTAINAVRRAWGKPMIITSGVRSKQSHLAIYREKARRLGIPFDEKKVPWGSSHLTGGAVDIDDDAKQNLWRWCLANEKLLTEAGLFMEHGDYTKTWCHFQVIAPNSGRRFFKP